MSSGVVGNERLSSTVWLIACLWVVLALVLVYGHGKNLALDRYVTNRLRFHAIPVAMSVLYHHHRYDYTAQQPLAARFQSDAPIDTVMTWARSAEIPAGSAPYYWVADDRGMADYVIAAFALFGPKIESLYAFYFVVLGSSCALFLVGFWREPMPTATLLFAIGALYACLSIIPVANPSGAAGEYPSLFEPRVLELLAFVATLHIAMANRSPGVTRPWLIALIGQIAIFIFCYHARSSVGWEAAYIIAASVLLLSRSLTGRRRIDRPARLSGLRLPVTVLLLFFAGFAGLSAYKHARYNPRYFEDMGARTVWHNALMGLGVNPAINVKYKVSIDDRAVIEAVITHRKSQDPRPTTEWTTQNILNSLGGWFVFDWFQYESAARSLYVHIWKADAVNVLHSYVVDKPGEVATVVTNAILRRHPAIAFNPVAVVPLIIIAPGLLFATRYGAHLGRWVVAASLLCLFALAPALMFYPTILVMSGLFASLALVLYFTMAVASQRLLRRTPLRSAARVPA